MARCAVPLRLLEVVDVDVAGVLTGDDLFPLDGLDVTKVVIVENAHRAFQNVWKIR